MFKTINKYLFYLGCITLLTSCWNRDEIPGDLLILPDVLQAPKQDAVDIDSFRVVQNEVNYKIEPRFDYELYGLVVSYKYHNAKFGLHKLWNDHLNVADVCVLWGANTSNLDLNKIDFWNGEFTCNAKTRDNQTWRKFREDQISNNHLLSDNERIRSKIEELRIGDQIHIRGWLTRYSNNQGFNRDTSTTRDDRGNGACETIFVQDFRILKRTNVGWHTLFMLSLIVTVLTSVIWLIAVGRGYW